MQASILLRLIECPDRHKGFFPESGFAAPSLLAGSEVRELGGPWDDIQLEKCEPNSGQRTLFRWMSIFWSTMRNSSARTAVRASRSGPGCSRVRGLRFDRVQRTIKLPL